MRSGFVYILCGLPFSGKSTFARRLARDRNATMICLDEINASRGLTGGGEGEIPDIEWKKSHEAALALLEESLRAESDVVIDDTNCFRFLRDNYRRVAKAYDATVFVVLVDTPVEEIERRIAVNEISLARHRVSTKVLADLVERFEWPGNDENCISPAVLFGDDAHHLA